TCGRSGGWSCAHLHSEWLPGAPPEGWWQWPYGWPKAAVEAGYYSPRDWWRAASAKVQGASPEAVMAILSGAQAAAVQAGVWGASREPAAADFAIPTSWRAEWQAGRWRGAPLSAEQPVPEDTAAGKPGGSWRLFEYGAACWLPGQDVSWNGGEADHAPRRVSLARRHPVCGGSGGLQPAAGEPDRGRARLPGGRPGVRRGGGQ